MRTGGPGSAGETLLALVEEFALYAGSRNRDAPELLRRTAAQSAGWEVTSLVYSRRDFSMQ